MISDQAKKQIVTIWQKYVKSDRVVVDSSGNPINEVDAARLIAIEDIKKLISGFLSNKLPLTEFKTALDGYNKRKNLWGFPAAKGQMFFNLMVNSTDSTEKLTAILRESIAEPKDLEDAKEKLEKFEAFVRTIYEKGGDKRKVPNPRSSGYFLSYFWQIHNPLKWPILYSSLVNSFEELGIWKGAAHQKDEYEYFYRLNDAIKDVISDYAKMDISNWHAEHAFWNHSGNPMISAKPSSPVITQLEKEPTLPLKANFNVADYLIPRVAKLVELGGSKDKNKGSEFEKMVSEAFRLLDFEVEPLGQGSGRNPDAVIKYREDHTAFIVDAKAYSEGYSLGIDDRAIREYINDYCPRLHKEGLKKIGFIIVSNSFKSDLENFISEITWTTDIKRFVLLTSEALRYLVAYRAKDNLATRTIIEFLVSTASPIKVEQVVAEFDDV